MIRPPMIFSDDQVAELDQPIEDRLVQQRKVGGGRSAPYVEGFEMFAEANTIFGYGNWGYRIIEGPYCIAAGGKDQVNQSTGEITRARNWELWGCKVQLDVQSPDNLRSAVSLVDIGTCVRNGLDDDSSLDMAVKGAVTDGVKRCLRAYGSRFGLFLYDKPDHAPQNQQGDRQMPQGLPSQQSSRPPQPQAPPASLPPDYARDREERRQPAPQQAQPTGDGQPDPLRKPLADALNTALEKEWFKRVDLAKVTGDSRLEKCLAWVHEHGDSIDVFMRACVKAAEARTGKKVMGYEEEERYE